MHAFIRIMSILVLVSCAAPQKEFPSVKTLGDVDTILVMPFQNMYAVYGNKTVVDCVVCNRRHVVREVPEGTTEFMTEHLIKLLMDDERFRFVFSGQSEEVPVHLPVDKHGAARMAEIAAATGAVRGVDAVLMGYLFHFKNRVGNSYSVESPASVSFSLFLVRVKDRQIVWHGIFEETQQALSENILKIVAFIQRKARWITAREMAAEGLEHLMSTFPKP